MQYRLLILLICFPLFAFGQQNKVAVYVTGSDPINNILGNRLVDGIAKSGKYIAIERTASFLTELSKEHNYQRTGSVDDSEISRIGKQFGVQYVCVATVFNIWNEKYISTRLIDVETVEVTSTSSSNGSIENTSQLISVLNELSTGLLASLEMSKLSTAKKVAVYVKPTGNKDIDIILGDQLVAGFAHSGRYFAIERTQGFLSQLSKEHSYQQTGAVDDVELSRLGKQFGVHYVCVANVDSLFGDYFISTRLINVETAEIANSHNEEGAKLSNSADVISVTQKIASILSDMTILEQHQKIQSNLQLEKERRALELEKSMQLEKLRGVHNGYEYVDLGLSVMWATCNVGANSPMEDGVCVAWGDTKPSKKYLWSTYVHGKKNALIKYNDNADNGKNGFVDNQIRLTSDDDIAAVEMGGRWRMPTAEELNELYDKCICVLNKLEDKLHFIIIGPNGNSIVLPLALSKDDSDPDYGTYGGLYLYWSSTLSYLGLSSCAMCISLDYHNKPLFKIGHCDRYIGAYIRPVFK